MVPLLPNCPKSQSLKARLCSKSKKQEKLFAGNLQDSNLRITFVPAKGFRTYGSQGSLGEWLKPAVC